MKAELDVQALDLAPALPGVEKADVNDLHRRVDDEGLAAALAALPSLADEDDGGAQAKMGSTDSAADGDDSLVAQAIKTKGRALPAITVDALTALRTGNDPPSLLVHAGCLALGSLRTLFPSG